MRLPKPLYNIDLQEVDWVMELPDKQKNKAYAIWKKREAKLFDLLMKCEYAYGYPFETLNKLTTDLYERMCAIKYPQCVKLNLTYINPHLSAGNFGIYSKSPLPQKFREKYFKK